MLYSADIRHFRNRRDYELSLATVAHCRSSAAYWASEAIRMREAGDADLWAHFTNNAVNVYIAAQAMVTERERRGL